MFHHLGYATRQCELVSGTAQWSREVNYLNCTTDIFLVLNEKVSGLRVILTLFKLGFFGRSWKGGGVKRLPPPFSVS